MRNKVRILAWDQWPGIPSSGFEVGMTWDRTGCGLHVDGQVGRRYASPFG